MSVPSHIASLIHPCDGSGFFSVLAHRTYDDASLSHVRPVLAAQGPAPAPKTRPELQQTITPRSQKIMPNNNTNIHFALCSDGKIICLGDIHDDEINDAFDKAEATANKMQPDHETIWIFDQYAATDAFLNFARGLLSPQTKTTDK